MVMSEDTKEHNAEILREIISEAEAALRNMTDDDIEEVQQNFMRIESDAQDLRI
jgi:predicted translin family RNA/ssDNA-binding protein